MAIFKIDIVYVGIFIFPVLHQYMNSLSLFYINDYTLSVISNPIKSEKMAESLAEQFRSLNIPDYAAATKKLRIASWNVNGLTTKSEARHQFIKCVAEAIKSYKFDIVAFQEISSNDALQRLCEALNENEMNNPWKCASQPIRQHDFLKLGFVWKCDIEIEVHDLPFDYFERRPYHLKFKFEGITINLVNLHLIQRGNDKSKRKVEISKKINNDKEQDQLIDLVRYIHVYLPGTLYQPSTLYQPGTYVFLIGDFNGFPWSKGLEMNKYVNLFPLRMYTNTKQDEYYDNIIVPDKIKCHRGVITADNLKLLSDHFPIWAEFSFYTASLDNYTVPYQTF